MYLGPIAENRLPEIAALTKQATACKRAEDWDGAIAALRQAKGLSEQWYDDSKLALYLQQAGRFDEAMREFQWLLDHCMGRCQRIFGHNGQATVAARYATACMRIHDKVALAAKREGRADLQQQHERKRDQYASLRARLIPLSRAGIKARVRR